MEGWMQPHSNCKGVASRAIYLNPRRDISTFLPFSLCLLLPLTVLKPPKILQLLSHIKGKPQQHYNHWLP